MEKEILELIASALNLETQNKYMLEDNFMGIFLPKGNIVMLTIKECTDFAPSNQYTTNKINRKIGYGKNNPHYFKIMLKNSEELGYYIVDMLNTLLNGEIKFVYIQKSPTEAELYYWLNI